MIDKFAADKYYPNTDEHNWDFVIELRHNIGFRKSMIEIHYD